MSLPRESLDQLLSGYLDDALSHDERVRVEQLLRDDPEVARELQQLRELRESLRELRRADQELTLGPNFADRVLKATVDQAAAEGLSEEHPVMLLTQQPSTTVARPGLPIAKIAGAVVALAASIVLAIVMLRPPAEDPKDNLIVQKDLPEFVDPSNVPPEPVIEQGTPGPVEQLVQDDTNNAPSPSEVPDTLEMSKDGGPADSIAEASPPDVSPDQLEPDQPDPEMLLRSMVMVVEVRLTDSGRENDAVSLAMDRAGINAPDQKRIDKNIVGFGKQLANEQDDAVTVLYLEDLGTTLDRFINEMVVDFVGVESVGFSHAMDAPIIQFANAMKRIDDPKTVRHETTSWELQDDGEGTLHRLANALGNRNFIAFNRDGAAAALKERNDGANFRSRIFVLVR